MQLLLARAFLLLALLIGLSEGARLLSRSQRQTADSKPMTPFRRNVLDRWKGPKGIDQLDHSTFQAHELRVRGHDQIDWARSVRDGKIETVMEKTEKEDKRTARDIAEAEALPCGDDTKIPSNWEYLERLMNGLCSMPTSAPECSSWSTHMECLLKEFYVANCAGVTNFPKDVCQKCSDPQFMSGTVTAGTYFPLPIQQFFKKQESQTYSSAAAGELVGKELLCGATMMVKDGCQGMTSNLPSCYK